MKKIFFALIISFLPHASYALDKKCAPTFSGPISIAEIGDTVVYYQDAVTLDFNNNKWLASRLTTGMKSCKNNSDWHCIVFSDFKLYIPKNMTENSSRWSYEKSTFIKGEEKFITLPDGKKKEMAAIASCQTLDDGRCVNPDYVYYIQGKGIKAKLLGYSQMNPDQDGNSYPTTYWLSTGDSSLSCF